MIEFLSDIAPYFFIFLSILIIIEGAVYFLHPEKVKWMLATAPPQFIRGVGIIIIIAGILCYFLALLILNS